MPDSLIKYHYKTIIIDILKIGECLHKNNELISSSLDVACQELEKKVENRFGIDDFDINKRCVHFASSLVLLCAKEENLSLIVKEIKGAKKDRKNLLFQEEDPTRILAIATLFFIINDYATQNNILTLMQKDKLCKNFEKVSWTIGPEDMRTLGLVRDFDVFLCYNRVDALSIRRIAKHLKKRGIVPWFDEWEMRPGLPWEKGIEEQIDKIKTAAVFVGKDGLGPWEDMERLAFLRQFVHRSCPVIPVILPDCTQSPQLPPLLGNFNWVDFRRLNPDPWEQLIWGITGQKRDLA